MDKFLITTKRYACGEGNYYEEYRCQIIFQGRTFNFVSHPFHKNCRMEDKHFSLKDLKVKVARFIEGYENLWELSK